MEVCTLRIYGEFKCLKTYSNARNMQKYTKLVRDEMHAITKSRWKKKERKKKKRNTSSL